MVEHEYHRREKPAKVVGQPLVIRPGHYGLSEATHRRLDRPAVKLHHRGADLLRMLDKGVDKRSLADPGDPVQVNYPGLPTQQVIEGSQLRCAADEGGSCPQLRN